MTIPDTADPREPDPTPDEAGEAPAETAAREAAGAPADGPAAAAPGTADEIDAEAEAIVAAVAAEEEGAADDDEDEAEESGDAPLDPEHRRLLEAILFASDAALSERELARRLPEGARLKALLRSLRVEYAGRGVNLVRAGRTWAFRTAPDLAGMLNIEVKVSRKPSRAAVETLAIISYHQPITRAEIEDVRGVGLSKGTLDFLFEQGWVKPGPRRETPGRPVTWVTTDAFLDHFGLESLKDLPGFEELKAAGLLESGPALSAYRTRGEIGAAEEGVPVGAEDSAAEEAAVPEPLDPEDGGEARQAMPFRATDAAE